MTIFKNKKSTIKENTMSLIGKSSSELAKILRECDVSEWNRLVVEARGGLIGFRANLRGAYLRGANLTDANLTDANLRGANLTDANLREHKLAGRRAVIGECAGYQVIMFATDNGHVLRAGCWTGQLEDAVQRATEERDSELVRAEAELVVAHGLGLLDAWSLVDSAVSA